MKKQWTSRIRRADWSPSSSSVVCDLHFGESDFKSPIAKSDTPVEKAMEPLERVRQPLFASNWTDSPSTSGILTDEIDLELESDPKDKEIATLKAEHDDAIRKLNILAQDYAEMKVTKFNEQSIPDEVLQMYTGL